ncbi:MFS transporter [Klenkia taihuensis]|uniref:MFS transporter, CP family, cyanate transporter n=1 Tax=Klenkia taihuensis TaxID=1225127 RepID=A0A1I1S9X4_9ACTN|nr:MFS transporter [Klenkia taihuensis]GHE13736.1 MFS transporter [Klenkia taihuensis]SFD40663.1 MFS transporter, CP family, cyanate transporter [Klenkia taihuensis]
MTTGVRARTAVPGLLLAGVLLVALNLRGPLVAVAPVAGELRSDLAVGAGTVGLLTSIPVLLFGLAAPVASWVIARAGTHRAVLLAMLGVLAGTVLRSVGDARTALAGTVVLGLAITVGNVVVPVVIGRDFPGATNVVTAAYTAALNVGATLTTTLTAPVADVVGWRWALAAWGLLVGLACLVWTAGLRRQAARADGSAGPPPPAGPVRPVWRQPAVWGLTVAFAAQAFSYYGVTAWLPTLLADEQGLSRSTAGVSSALFQVFAVAGAFAVPALVRWWRRPAAVLLAVTAAWAFLPVGLLTAPGLWPVWCSVAGVAQGGGITVVFIAIVARSRDLVENRRTSAMVQGGGYAVAATGPLVVGSVHDLTGGWTVPMLLVLGAIVVMAVAGGLSAGGRQQEERARG